MSWWKHATTEQRLAQIDGAFECGMSSRALAKNVGCSGSAVREFAKEHGRTFPYITRGWSSQAITASLNTRRRNRRTSETQAHDAFDIFGVKRHEEILSWGGE